ncbi:MAG: hypothetical protein R3C49_21655 [Planctomycetaceae bacterium]
MRNGICSAGAILFRMVGTRVSSGNCSRLGLADSGDSRQMADDSGEVAAKLGGCWFLVVAWNTIDAVIILSAVTFTAFTQRGGCLPSSPHGNRLATS